MQMIAGTDFSRRRRGPFLAPLEIMALAAIVVSGWRAGRAVAACVAFGALEALQITLQGPSQRSAGAYLILFFPMVVFGRWLETRMRWKR